MKRDLVGEIFGRLKVIYEYIDKETNENKVLCTCKCGNTVETTRKNLLLRRSRLCNYCYEKQMNLGKLKYLNSEERQLYRDYKAGAIQRDYTFELTEQEFKDLIYSECYYCGLRGTRRGGNKNGLLVNGIDRLDNLKGYETDNCVACCTVCNKMKSNLTEKEFMTKVKQIYLYRYEE